VKRADVEWARRARAVQDQLFPERVPQERVLNVIPFLARHGEQLLHELLARIEEPFAVGKGEAGAPGPSGGGGPAR
jgi:hypothetical protein